MQVFIGYSGFVFPYSLKTFLTKNLVLRTHFCNTNVNLHLKSARLNLNEI
jgi:hypothetical protein